MHEPEDVPPTPSLSCRENLEPQLISYNRALNGIEAVITNLDSMPPLPTIPAGIGRIVSSYLVAHRYSQPAIDFIVAAFNCSTSADNFVAFLVLKGMPVTEAEWIYQMAATE